MALSKEQLENDPKIKYRKWFWLWERDLLECARRWSEWREKAHELGFKDEKINALWSHPDAGRLIKYMESPEYKRKEAIAAYDKLRLSVRTEGISSSGDSSKTTNLDDSQAVLDTDGKDSVISVPNEIKLGTKDPD